MEELYLASSYDGRVRDVLVSHNGDSEAIKENMWWKGMLLLPYANRIAYVSDINDCIEFESVAMKIAIINFIHDIPNVYGCSYNYIVLL